MKRLRLLSVASCALVVFSAAPAEAQCTATETATLIANPAFAAPGDQFGVSIAIEGDTAVVGAWLETNANGANAGSAYVFERDLGGTDNWGEAARLISPAGGIDGAFGFSVDIDGDTIVIGEYREDTVALNAGAAHVFERDLGGAGSWGHRTTLDDPTGGPDDSFGWSVCIDVDTAAISARRKDVDGTEDGAVFIFERDLGGANNWGETKQVDASDGGDFDLFGQSVAINGDTVIVGAYQHDDVGVGADSGAAYIYERDGGGVDNWGEGPKLLAGDRSADDAFGFSVAIELDTAVVGAYTHDHCCLDSGGAYVFERNNGGANAWGETTELVGSGTNARDWFGYDVAIQGDRAVVGAYLDFGLALESGAVYAFNRDWGGTDTWSESHLLLASDGTTGDRFGYSVAVEGTTALSGAIFNDPFGTNSGMGYVFDLASAPIAYCTAGTSASGCQGLISAAGVPSATATSGFDLTVNNLEGLKNGIFFFGTNGRQGNPWGNGTSRQCVVPPVIRTPISMGIGTNGACDGVLTIDLNATWCSTCTFPLKNPGVGALVQAQLWYRDPFNTSNQTTSLSNAIEFTVCP